MDTQTEITAFDSLVDRGVDPVGIDSDSIRNEAGTLNSDRHGANDAIDTDLDAWRTTKLHELFYHVEFMVDRLRHLVDSGEFDESDAETRETIYRLNLSTKSIHHLANQDDSLTLKRMQRSKVGSPS